MKDYKPKVKVLDDLKTGRASCFSPEAMLVTFLIEFIGAAWVFFRYRLNQVTVLVGLLLIFLGTFQLAEFLICDDPSLEAHMLAQIGYMSITMLPPLGISLAMAIANKRSAVAQFIMYASAAAFVIYWGFFHYSIDSEKCYGNYVFIDSHGHSMWIYGTYYYVFLAIGTSLALYWSFQTKDRLQALALRMLTAGYMIFIIPTIAVALIEPRVDSSIPSVMCGFAVGLALILIFGVIPAAGIKRPYGKDRDEENKMGKHKDDFDEDLKEDVKDEDGHKHKDEGVLDDMEVPPPAMFE